MRLVGTLSVAAALWVALSGAAAAQNSKVFRITVALANVRAEPTTKSDVLSQLPRGVSVDVIRELAGWVNVSIPRQDGTRTSGFVAATLGVLEVAAVQQTSRETPVDRPAQDVAPRSSPAPTDVSPPQPSGTLSQRPVDQPTVQPATPPPLLGPIERYRLGAGGHFGGSSFGIGGTMRYWATEKAAFEMQVSRFSLGFGDASRDAEFVGIETNASILQFSPLVIAHALDQTAADSDVWLRPYVGGGLNMFRASSNLTVRVGSSTERESESDTSLGAQVFGGTEIVFRDLPRLVVSVDLGYHTTGKLFNAFSVGGFAYGIGAHWYFK